MQLTNSVGARARLQNTPLIPPFITAHSSFYRKMCAVDYRTITGGGGGGRYSGDTTGQNSEVSPS